MDPQIVVHATGDFRRLYGDLSKAEGRFGRLGGAVRAGIVGATIAGGAALVKLGADAVDSASKSQQSIGASEAVFGQYADVVVRRSKEAADAVGLSANEYRELANVTGAMLQTSGMPLRQVTDLTDKLNRRAADMAATFGGETREAVEAISSLLRGEADPIERYGVSIKQSDVNARLAAKGLEDLEGKARKQAEQTARLELLFRQTSRSAGQFAEESDTLAGSQQRLDAKVEDVSARFGNLLLPLMTDVTDWAGDELIPALEDLAGWFETNKDEIGRTAGELKDKLVPYLQTATDVVQAGIEFWQQLPGPVKEFGTEAAVAAAILPRLNSAISTGTGALGGFITNVRDAETRTNALKGAARNAAGVGGLLALVKGAQEADEATGDMLTTLGGAALGFSVGGPWGAVVGAIGGVTTALLTGDDQADRYRESVEKAKERVDSFRDSLDSATGALTANTRATVLMRLEEEGALDAANRLGVSHRDLVSATLGNEGAARRVKAAYNQVFTGGNAVMINGQLIQLQGNTSALSADSDLLANTIGDVSREFRTATKEERAAIRASQDLTGKLKGIPKNVRLKVEERGVPVTLRGLANLARRADLVPKEIRTLIEAADLPYTVKQIRNYQGELDKTDKKRPAPKLSADDRRLKDAITGGKRGLDELHGKKAKPTVELDLSAFQNDRRTVMTQLSTIPDEYVNIWITERRTGGGNRGGGTDRVPRALPTTDPFGLERAVDDLQRVIAPKAERAGKSVVAKLLRGITGGSGQVRQALDRLTDYIEKRINLKDDKKERARERAVLKHLKDEYAALVRNGKAQDANNRKIERARQHLEEVRSWVEQVKQAFIETGDVVQLGKLDDGAVSGPLLLDQLRDKVANAQRFAQIIRDLTDNKGVKINQTTLAQLLAAGPEAGLATAEALALGGDAAIKEINDLTAQLAQVGQQLGSQMSNQFFDLGLDASLALVQGLEAEQRALDRAARRLARRLAAAVRNALGGKDKNSRQIADALGSIPLGGISATTATTSGRTLGRAMFAGFQAAQIGAGAAAPQTISVSVKLTAEQVTALQRGKAATLDIDLGQSRGVRRLNVTGRT